MPLSPYIEQLLEAYEPERLQALVHWLEADSPVATNDSLIQEKEVFPMSAPNVDNALTEIQAGAPAPLDDLIVFSILDEFGPEFMGKPCFRWLSQCLSQHFTAQAHLS